MPFHRRRSRPRMGPVVQSYKKVLNFAPASHSAGGFNFTLVTGVDSISGGQGTPTDALVPTGSIVKFIEIQYAVQNLTALANFMFVSVQSLNSGQTVIAPNVVGGNPQRNQVHYQMVRGTGPNQNSNYVIRFKIPKKYQRVREGSSWNFRVESTTTFSDVVQVIYKFYR